MYPVEFVLSVFVFSEPDWVSTQNTLGVLALEHSLLGYVHRLPVLLTCSVLSHLLRFFSECPRIPKTHSALSCKDPLQPRKLMFYSPTETISRISSYTSHCILSALIIAVYVHTLKIMFPGCGIKYFTIVSIYLLGNAWSYLLLFALSSVVDSFFICVEYHGITWVKTHYSLLEQS